MPKFLETINFLVNYPLFKLGQQDFSLAYSLQIFISLLILVFIIKFTKIFCKNWLLAKLGFDVGNREAFATLIAYSTGVIGAILILQAIKLNFASLAFLAGGLGIGIGFGLQSITRDFISGLIVLLGRSIKVNDFIQFGARQEFKDLQGTVTKITLLSTIVQTKDGGSLILPNSYLVIFPILNWSYEKKYNKIKIIFKVNKDADLVFFSEIVLDAAYREPTVLQEPPPQLIFKAFGSNYCEFELKICINNLRDEDYTKNAINHAINYYLQKQGIKIYYSYDLSLQESYLPVTGFFDNLQKSPASLILNSNHSNNKPNKPLYVSQILRKVTYFETLTDLELQKLIEVGYRKKLAQEQILFNEGDAGDAFYIVLSGAVEVFVPKINKHLARLETGAFFGELSLILGIPRTASVKALEPTILFVINHQAFQEILQDNLDLAEVIINELAKHQEELAQRQQQLREMGLIVADEDDKNLVSWVRKRLTRLFVLS